MRVWRTLLCALLWAVGGSAGAETHRPSLAAFFAEDSDGAFQHSLTALYERRHEQALFGAGAGSWRFTEGDQARDFRLLELRYNGPSREGLAFLRARWLDGAQWNPLLLNGSWRRTVSDRWYVELFGERELIDSIAGLDRQLLSTGAGLSADYRINPDVTLVGALFGQRISDGNRRLGAVVRLIYQPPWIAGLNLQTRSTAMRASFDGVGYFSPAHRQEHLLMLGYSRALFDERFSLRLLAGPGLQRLRNSFGDRTRNTLFFAELRLRGWFSDHYGLELSSICTNTGGPNDGFPASDYRYCSGQLSLIGSW